MLYCSAPGRNKSANVLGKSVPKRPRALIGLLTLMLVGTAIGIAVVALFVGTDYVVQTSNQFYFDDNRDAILTLLTLGVFIGAAIGLGWGIIHFVLLNKRRNENDENPATRKPEA
jgi:hypothetical protein